MVVLIGGNLHEIECNVVSEGWVGDVGARCHLLDGVQQIDELSGIFTVCVFLDEADSWQDRTSERELVDFYFFFGSSSCKDLGWHSHEQTNQAYDPATSGLA